MNQLYYGDNLDVLRRKIATESVDLCYIDPPFNSKRNYNQIYDTPGIADRAQAQAFTDMWVWDDHANTGYDEILSNPEGRFQPQLIELMKGYRAVLGKTGFLAYLVSISLRVTEIRRVLKPEGTFYLHCDPTASHYLKTLMDVIFGPRRFLNEIVWCYNVGGKGKKYWARKHDTILFYAKGLDWFFDGLSVGVKRDTGIKSFGGIIAVDEEGRKYQDKLVKASGKYYRYYLDEPKIPEDWWTGINSIQSQSDERLGYPTQKPEALLERIIMASCRPGGLVLDAYCGCGTTLAVAERLGRRWIGVDITYQSISLVLRRLEKRFGIAVLSTINIDGIPRDMASAEALAHKKDDRLRKEFEKWAVLTYTNNRAVINEKKGADAGVDARAYFRTSKSDNAKIIFQVKSGGVKRSDVATLRGDMEREQAALAILITLEAPSGPMQAEAKAVGQYSHAEMGRSYDRLSIVTVRDIVEKGERLEIPMSLEVLAAAKLAAVAEQLNLTNLDDD